MVGSETTIAYWQSQVGAAPQVQFFLIARGGTNAGDAVGLATVTLRLLKYPAVNATQPTQHVTVTITEPRAGVFEATTLDTEWIEILSVVPLP